VARPPFRPIHAALLLLLALAVAAVVMPGRTQREDRGDVLRALQQARGPALPSPAHAGASSATTLARYGRDTLADVIDGAAEGYLGNGFKAAAMATYAFEEPGLPVVEVAAEAHRFETEAGAQAQLEAERPRRSAPVRGVEGAVSDGAVLLARAGADLLKLTVLTAGGARDEPLAAIARAWRRERP
jgi:hypothetical protein